MKFSEKDQRVLNYLQNHIHYSTEGETHKTPTIFSKVKISRMNTNQGT